LVISLLAIDGSKIYQGSLETFLCNSRIKIFRRGLVTSLSRDFGIKIIRRGLVTSPSKEFLEFRIFEEVWKISSLSRMEFFF